jgi:type III secretion protein L
MWAWMHVGDIQVGVSDGLVRRAQMQSFSEVVGLLGSLRQEADGLAAQARAQGEAWLAQAAAEADVLRAQAQADANVLQQQAREAGQAQGLAEAAAQWHARRLDTQWQRSGDLAAQKQIMAQVVVSAVERIVRVEPAHALVERALAQVGDLLRGAAEARLCVHPADVPSAQRAVDALPALRGGEGALQVVGDPTLAPHSCRFESDLGVLDASLDLQLASLRRAIEAACAKAAAVPDDEPVEPPAVEPVPTDAGHDAPAPLETAA